MHFSFAVQPQVGGVRSPFRPRLLAAGIAAALSPGLLIAQTTPQRIESVTVTATRTPQSPFDVPASIDVLTVDEIRVGQLQVNISESLARVPGLVANNRQNYAQDLQISSRGFGSRASFGVRGIRLYSDGIPAAGPDGQGQVSHFALGSAERIEVLRGPFSALYGNSSGGVISIFTEDGQPGARGEVSLAGGSDSTWRVGGKVSGAAGIASYVLDASQFQTDGPRDQSAAERTLVNGKLKFALSPSTTATFVVNSIRMPEVQDPLGLTRAEFDANSEQVTAVAKQFNTRKDTDQSQGGAVLEHRYSDALEARAMVYFGTRNVRQFQSIPVATQTPVTHPGGVIDFDRDYGGTDIRGTFRTGLAGGKLAITAGINFEQLDEARKGYQNFLGSGATATLGVLGPLRRDEDNRVKNNDQYLQAEWSGGAWRAFAGVRASEVKFRSQDKYIVGANGDDSGNTTFRSTNPAGGIMFQPNKSWSLYLSAGRGFETPTFNELAYRPDGKPGLNFDLKPAKSDNLELGAKWRANGAYATLAIFQSDTKDEIVTQTNSGGRTTFTNAAKSRREGAEAALQLSLSDSVTAYTALTYLDATYREAYLTCTGVPCTRPATTVLAGNRIPGTAKTTAFAELKWALPQGYYAAVEVRHTGKLFVNDLNTEAASAYTVGALRAGTTLKFGGVTVKPFLRIDNIADRKYAGSVIVNEGNARFFEPAPGRSFLAGVTIENAL